MKTLPRFVFFPQLFPLLALTAFTPLWGQGISPSTSAHPDGTPVRLSPFIVDTAKDNGVVANSSLAGGRLASGLADTPAAYSVLTREFIDALDITNLATAIEPKNGS